MKTWILLTALFGVASASPDICDQTFQVLKGQTRTINYLFDTNYPGNANCVFHLSGTGTAGLVITFTQFDVEPHSACKFDYLEVFDGPTTRSRSLGKLCGYLIPAPVETEANTATLKFVSDRTLHKTGFILQFTTGSREQFQSSCEKTFTKESGSFNSPMYPNHYPNRVNCTYEITPPSGNQILIQFPTFKVERSSYCVMDYVEILTRTGQQIGPKLCGDLDGNAYLVPGSHGIIKFISDRSSTRQGFVVKYRSVDTCKELDDVCLEGCRTGEDNMLECLCKTGFSAPTGQAQCYDINECKTNNGGCADHCKNTQGSFECECRGDGLFLAPDGVNCTDRTCEVDNAGCEHNCHLAGDGGYFCTCNTGFLIDSDRHNCSDINECTSKKYQHGCDQLCVNEPGSYYCDCEKGYTLSSNRRTCNDIDECVTQGLNCNQECHNYPGGWTCACYPGYQVNPSDPNECIDINECSSDVIPDNCVECINFHGGFSCTTCEDGFVQNEDETLCIDVNECEKNNGGCQQECINLPGSYRCSCYTGQELVKGKNGVCKDINECAPNDGRGPCEHYCENSVGSFTCHCLEGYEVILGSGTTCQDIDECMTGNGGCQQKCTNNQGSYVCSCFPGYWMIDGTCKDVDECLESKPCDKKLGASCVNTVGSFRCICPHGYEVVNTTICQDIDECSNGTYGPTHDCEQNCVNTPGSFRCECHPGYVDIGNNTCTDINECSQPFCEHQDLCVNTIGSFQCSCPPGFFLLADGLHCSDVDECASGTVACHQKCLNRIGHYDCDCYDGYELGSDNYTCIDMDECATNTSGCSDGCVNTMGGFRCHCYQGYQFKKDSNLTCEDKNECEVDNGGCHHVCDNTEGSFRCGCRDGYTADRNSRCVDIDECATDNGGCDQHCKNSNGTYSCTCDPNFKLGVDKHSCGHCPSCETFEQVQADVASLKPLLARVDELVASNMQLSATVSLLRQEVDALRRKVDEKR